MATDPQTAAREMVVELDHPRARQHTREVLSEFGFSSVEIEALLASGPAVAS
jgi:crotonobetainyl-CoA:carnitine CoA-transferase CaiB-like acyl-CoA transferase